MCFVLAWKTRFEASDIGERLSHHIIGVLEIGIFSSCSSIRSHVISAAIDANEVEDLETVGYIFADQTIGFLPK